MPTAQVLPPDETHPDPIIFGSTVGQEYTSVDLVKLVFFTTAYHKPDKGVTLYAIADKGSTTESLWEYSPMPKGYAVGDKLKATHFDGAAHTESSPLAIYVGLTDGFVFQDDASGTRPSTVFERQRLIYDCGTTAVVGEFDQSSAFPAMAYVNPHVQWGRDTCKSGYVQFADGDVFSTTTNYIVYWVQIFTR